MRTRTLIAIPVGRQVVDERARPWSRRSPRALAKLALARIAPLHAGVRIATFSCAAPARCGAFADERRVVARRRRRPAVLTSVRSRRSPRACRCGTSALPVPRRLPAGRVFARALPSAECPQTGQTSANPATVSPGIVGTKRRRQTAGAGTDCWIGCTRISRSSGVTGTIWGPPQSWLCKRQASASRQWRKFRSWLRRSSPQLARWLALVSGLA